MSRIVEVPLSEGEGTPVAGLRLLELARFEDERGWFMETWHDARYAGAGLDSGWAQDNVSHSGRGVLRGLHFQRPPAEQCKLILVLHGEIFDVAVDVRHGSATFGRWFGCTLSAANGRQLYIPAGCAHGFLVRSEAALVSYKCSTVYDPAAERALRWDDPDVGIEWPEAPRVVSMKDRAAPGLHEATG